MRALSARLAAAFSRAGTRGGKPLPLAELKRDTQGLHRLFPEDARHLALLAMNLIVRGHSEQAFECLEEAMRRGFPEEHVKALKARDCFSRKEYRQALEIVTPLLAADRANSEAHELAGAAHFFLHNLPAACSHYRESVRLDPANAVAHASFSAVLGHDSRFEEALAEAQHALRYDPRSHAGLKNLACACAGLMRPREEEEVLRLALRYYPNDPDFEFQYGTFKMRQGDYPDGWPLYERRFDVDPDVIKVRPEMRKRARWQGEPLAGKTLLVFGEQGAGDNIMAARLLPAVKARGGGTVMLEVVPALTGLLGRVPGIDAVIALDGLREPSRRYDFWIPIMSLPGLLGFDPYAEPAPQRYLYPTPESAQYWRERMARFPGRKVGIAWSGNPQHKNDAARSIPFELVRSLIDESGATFFSLQLSPGWGPELRKPPTLVDFTEELVTFDDTAGLAECMDVVISVDTSVAHLAGALGRPTWLLVPYVAEWRWGAQGERTPWYPSMTVLRQPKSGDWASVLRQVRERLAAL